MENVHISTIEDVIESINDLTPWNKEKLYDKLISDEDIERIINRNPQKFLHLIDDDTILDYVRDHYDADDLTNTSTYWN